MEFSRAKKEFDIRYYQWSISEFHREIDTSCPTLSSFKTGSAWKTYQLMLTLRESDQRLLAEALVKKFHPNAVAALGEQLSAEEESLLARRRAFPTNLLTIDAEVQARKRSGEPINVARKRKLRNAVMEELKRVFGDRRAVLTFDDEGPDLSFTTKVAGWIVKTPFDFGRNETVLSYYHKIESEAAFPYGAGMLGMGMGGWMSFNSHLGISSQTSWAYITVEEVPLYAELAVAVSARLFLALPNLLEGLECETMVPDILDIRGF